LQNSGATEVYNLAAQSFVGVSFEQPITTAEITGIGPVNLLEAIRIVNPKIRFYQASTSEMFGKVQAIPQIESTPFYPRSPYGVAKLYAYNLVRNYRESYNMFAANGILFNHESPLRGENFVTRKITIGISEIFHGYKKILEIGNFNSKRDWGHARDYAEAIYRILQHRKPLDLVIATNKSYSIKDFIKECFKFLKIKVQFIGKGLNEKVVDENGKVWIIINKKFIRPKDIKILLGNSSLAKKVIKWKNKTSFKDLVIEMMKEDLRKVSLK
jgi:GDPmannose 4,6-dehydratase